MYETMMTQQEQQREWGRDEVFGPKNNLQRIKDAKELIWMVLERSTSDQYKDEFSSELDDLYECFERLSRVVESLS
jgi:hypothetical protein